MPETQKHATPTGTSKTGIPWFNFPGYNDHGLISAAILIPSNRRIVVTSGHVGTNDDGKAPESLEEEITICFEKIEKSIKAVDPTLSPEEIFASIYSVTSFTTAGFGREQMGILIKVANKFFGDHRPTWTAIGAKELNGGVRFELQVQAALP